MFFCCFGSKDDVVDNDESDFCDAFEIFFMLEIQPDVGTGDITSKFVPRVNDVAFWEIILLFGHLRRKVLNML